MRKAARMQILPYFREWLFSGCLYQTNEFKGISDELLKKNVEDGWKVIGLALCCVESHDLSESVKWIYNDVTVIKQI